MAQGFGAGTGLALGRYELRIELAKSQLGSLWIAQPTGSEPGPSWVCIRRIRTGPPLSIEDAQRLSKVAWASASIRHPSVLAVLDVVGTEHELGIVSEAIDCEPVRSITRLPNFRRSPLSPRIALRVALDVLEGLDSIYACATETDNPALALSGGLAPDSVLLCGDGRTRLTDIGTASLLRTIPKLAGHPDLAAYAAPEQLAFSSAPDQRADVFSLGVLLWELATGRRLFVAATLAAVAEKVRSAEVPRLDASPWLGAPSFPREAADPIARALERDPKDRFGNVAEMRAAVAALEDRFLASHEEVAERVQELAAMAFAARESVLYAPDTRSDSATAPVARSGALLSSAPPKPGRSSVRPPLTRSQTLPGVAPEASPRTTLPPESSRARNLTFDPLPASEKTSTLAEGPPERPSSDYPQAGGLFDTDASRRVRLRRVVAAVIGTTAVLLCAALLASVLKRERVETTAEPSHFLKPLAAQANSGTALGRLADTTSVPRMHEPKDRPALNTPAEIADAEAAPDSASDAGRSATLAAPTLTTAAKPSAKPRRTGKAVPARKLVKSKALATKKKSDPKPSSAKTVQAKKAAASKKSAQAKKPSATSSTKPTPKATSKRSSPRKTY